MQVNKGGGEIRSNLDLRPALLVTELQNHIANGIVADCYQNI